MTKELNKFVLNKAFIKGDQMLYIDSLTLHNFKSFKYAKIRFGKGFSCIVGPNGSGKSCICDALLFVLGETSLKRLRVHTLSKLINDSAKPPINESSPIASVKLEFSGDEKLEIAKAVKHGNKVSYRLNGKRVTRTDVIEALRHHFSQIDETNTITQGEITKMLDLSAKERREMIDSAAGIKEFNEKKMAALKELEKVEMRINEAMVVLNERIGFLKELEKEKREAERYLLLKANTAKISYKILKTKEVALSSEYETIINSIHTKDISKKELEVGISKMDDQVNAIFSEKQKLLTQMNKGSSEMSSLNRELEEANTYLAVNDSKIKSITENLEKTDQRITVLQEEKSRISKESSENSKKIVELSKQLEQKSKNAEVVNLQADQKLSRFENLNTTIEQMNISVTQLSTQQARYTSELESISTQQLTIETEIETLCNQKSFATSELEKKQSLLSEIIKNKSNQEMKLSKMISEKEQIDKRINQINADTINTRELLAMQGASNDAVTNAIRKTIKSGFYGKAYELCSYDDKYASAVNAAASSRLNYFIVDSSETAAIAIKLLKSQNAGRATFIPLEDIVIQKKESQTGSDALIDHITYDKKFSNAFMYIFSNTFVVSSIADAKKKGYGRNRFVTLEGELIEPSGAITGGSMNVIRSPIALHSKLKKLESEFESISSSTNQTIANMEELKSQIAKFQTQELDISIQTKYTNAQMDQINAQLKPKQEQLKSIIKTKEQVEKTLKLLKDDQEKAIAQLSEVKHEATKQYSEINSLISTTKKSSSSTKNSAAKQQSQREEIEELKISLASVSKENQMLQSRGLEIENEISTNSKSISDYNDQLSQIKEMQQKRTARRDEIQETIKAHDKGSASLYKQVSILENKISGLSQEKGRMKEELERIERHNIELSGNKMQIETRLSDIKAELLQYTSEIDISKDDQINNKSTTELDSILYSYKKELESMGAVNLKAPELFDTKKKEVEDATAKSDILKNESDSIRKMINEIDAKKMRVFMETYNKINENFKRLYGYIFDGSATLMLENQKDPFISGLSFTILSNKITKAFDGMSGGERSLIMLMLIFAIQQCATKSFYVFDEIDSALDKENSSKLSLLMKQMSQSAQFLVVSHNDALITSADTAIGVIKTGGESKVVGIQLTSEAAK